MLSPAAAEPRTVTGQVQKRLVAQGELSVAQQYCVGIAGAAADARLAWQAAKLKELEAALQKRIDALEAKRAEHEEWLKKREDLMRKAEDGVVAVVSRMRPDAAAAHLLLMEEATAAAVVAKLNPRAAGAILNEMDPAKAAKLTDMLTGGQAKPQEGKKS
jgi:flagellar motility protein MotE (MotC chaperone)